MKDSKWIYLVTGSCALGGLYLFMGMSFSKFFIKHLEAFVNGYGIFVFILGIIAPFIIAMYNDIHNIRAAKASQRVTIVCLIVGILNLISFYIAKNFSFTYIEDKQRMTTFAAIVGVINLLFVLYHSIKLTLKKSNKG